MLPPDARILLVPSSYSPKVGGLETATAYLAAELARRGYAVTIVTNRYPRTLAGYERINGLPVHRILMTDVLPSREQAPRLIKYLLGVAIAPMQLARLARLIRRVEPTVTNAHYLGVPAMYTRIADMFHSTGRFVLSVHGSDLPTVPYPTGYPSASRFVVAGAHALTACSKNMAGFLRRLMGGSWDGSVIVTGNGVEPSELQTTERFEHPRPYLFAAAHFTPKKGLDVLIRAMNNLINAGLDVDLVLAGCGPLDETLRSLVRELGLNTRVLFWGVASRREMAALLNECALFVLPSLWEAFGIVALEAMVCGKAVVATNRGGIAEVVRHNESGILVEPGDVGALSRAIATLLRDPAQREALGQCGREVALSEFSWSAVTDRYLQAYAVALSE